MAAVEMLNHNYSDTTYARANAINGHASLSASILGAIALAAGAVLQLDVPTQTVPMWAPILTALWNGQMHLLESLYACIVIQACAAITLEPVCLLTPDVLKRCITKDGVLSECGLVSAARQVLRIFKIAAKTTDTFDSLWEILPFCGVAPTFISKYSQKQLDIGQASMHGLMHVLDKEQLCTIDDFDFTWRSPRPPYIETVSLMIHTSLHGVAPIHAIPPLSVLEPSQPIIWDLEEKMQTNDTCHLIVDAEFKDKDMWALLLVDDIIQWHDQQLRHVKQGNLPTQTRFKMFRQLGARAKTVLGLDRILHWQLRQSVEGHLGHLIYSLYFMHRCYEVKNWANASGLCIAAGIRFNEMPHQQYSMASPVPSPQQHKAMPPFPNTEVPIKLFSTQSELSAHAFSVGRPQWKLTDEAKDLQMTKGFLPHFLAMTDRWGCYRELDQSQRYLILKVCHHSDSTRNSDRSYGCPLRFKYNRCGCACPYFHARSKKIAEKLVKACRNWEKTTAMKDTKDLLSSWEYSIHFRDENNNPAFSNFPSVQGAALTSTGWQVQQGLVPRPPGDPSHRIKSHCRVDAMTTNMQRLVDDLLQHIAYEWGKMNDP